jgi:hypothetical protein
MRVAHASARKISRPRGDLIRRPTMTPEERTARQKQLNVWRDARRANLSFPHGRDMTQEQRDEQRRLKGEQEKARLALDDLDAARAVRDTDGKLHECADTGTRP